MNVTALFNAPRAYLDFIENYISTIKYFYEAVEYYPFSGSRQDQYETRIQNTDLWIESRLEYVPGLTEFRTHVRAEMKRLGIEQYPSYIYAPENNHYVNLRYKSTVKGLEEVKAFLSQQQ